MASRESSLPARTRCQRSSPRGARSAVRRSSRPLERRNADHGSRCRLLPGGATWLQRLAASFPTISTYRGRRSRQHGEEFASEELGVRAIDEFTFQVDLGAPAPHFLMLCYSFFTVPLPAHAIEAARVRGREASWIEPGNIVTSGPFLLTESRPRERIVVSKNPSLFRRRVGGYRRN